MSNSVDGIFSRSVFGPPGETNAQKQKAAEGFSQIFGSLLAKQMRTALGGGKGPLGISDGASSEIYGGFFDQAMGKVLAHSRAMRPINRTIVRELGGVQTRGKHAGSISNGQQMALQRAMGVRPLSFATYLRNAATATLPENLGAVPMTQIETGAPLPSNAHGPILLPPRPTSMAPLLPSPGSVGG